MNDKRQRTDIISWLFQLPLKDFNAEDAQSIDLGEELKSFKRVSFYWVEAPGKVLSIILKLPRPAGSEC